MKNPIQHTFLWYAILSLSFGLETIKCGTITPHETWQDTWPTIDRQNKDEFVVDTVKVLSKKPDFIIGAASAEYQILGSTHLPNSQMAHGETLMVNTDKSQDACGGWKQHKNDIKLLKDCRLNGYRFSIDWSAIEPREGEFDKSRIQHYVNFCKKLRKNNIKVMVTLHHFVHPQWFEELGAFEKRDNNHYFIRFCREVFLELAPYVDYWCTINEPGIYVFQSYIRGVFPPFKSVPCLRGETAPPHVPDSKDLSSKKNIALAGTVLRNLLQAHVDVYEVLKDTWKKHKEFIAQKEDRGVELSELDKAWDNMQEQPRIGFVHQYLTFRNFNRTHRVMPYQDLCGLACLSGAALMAILARNNNNMPQGYSKAPLYTLAAAGAFLTRGIVGRFEAAIAYVLNNWINESVMKVFETEEFNFWGAGHLTEQISGAGSSFDFAGLNYYSVVSFNLLQPKPGPGYYKHDIRTDMPYGIYAEGLYRAIQRVNKLGKPIYITENGISDRDDTIRPTWIKRHFVAVTEAINEGCDVRGFFYWSLLDNWEWDMGYKQNFGLYKVDFASQDKSRSLYPGARLYKKIADALRRRTSA